MAKSEFKLGKLSKITTANALKSASLKDARNATFHITADTDEILTLTGEFFEQEWSKGDNEGTMLLAGAKKADGSEIKVAFGFFRTKKLLQEDGLKTFKACFDKDASFEEIVNGIEAGKKIQVKRDDYVYPGRSSARAVDTVVWVD
jgi:hypothetical protein